MNSMQFVFWTLGFSAAFVGSAIHDPWGENVQPNLHTDYLLDRNKGSLNHFLGNQTHADYFKLLRKDGSSLLIGARNVVYNLSLPDLTENIEQRIIWPPSDVDRELCILKGKSQDDCQNYIRVLAGKDDGKLLLVCGTNAYNPKCRRYSTVSNSYNDDVVEEFSGKGICPYDPRHNSTWIYTGGDFYSGTVADFSGSDPLILKNALRTDQYDAKQLNSPDFVSALEDDDYVYFFFREAAVEYINCGKMVYSRVARVCKNDKGVPHVFKNKLTTFLKARLNCSVPGETPFYFNEIQSASGASDGLGEDKLIYAVFTTPDNSISGSAVCAFRLADIRLAFDEGPFKGQSTSRSNWLPVPKQAVPKPRPGSCGNVTERGLPFIQEHPLMDLSVPGRSPTPLLVKTSLAERFTVITTDPEISTLSGQQIDVLFVGTSSGRILKFFNLEPEGTPVLVESMQVMQFDTPVKNLMVVNDHLVVLSNHDVKSVPLYRCSAVRSCGDCIALQDPYCGWDLERGFCIRHDDSLSSADNVLQQLASGFHTLCPAYPHNSEPTAATDSPTTTTVKHLDSSEATSPMTTTSRAEETSTATAIVCECPSLPFSTSTPPFSTSTMSNPVFVPFFDVGSANNDEFGGFEGDVDENEIKDDDKRHREEKELRQLPRSFFTNEDADVVMTDYSKETKLPSLYTGETLAASTICAALVSLIIGVVVGMVASKKLQPSPPHSPSGEGRGGGKIHLSDIYVTSLALKKRAKAAKLAILGKGCSHNNRRQQQQGQDGEFGYETPSNLTNTSVVTQVTSVSSDTSEGSASTPPPSSHSNSSPMHSPASSSSTASSSPPRLHDSAKNLSANVPQKSEPVKMPPTPHCITSAYHHVPRRHFHCNGRQPQILPNPNHLYVMTMPRAGLGQGRPAVNKDFAASTPQQAFRHQSSNMFNAVTSLSSAACLQKPKRMYL